MSGEIRVSKKIKIDEDRTVSIPDIEGWEDNAIWMLIHTYWQPNTQQRIAIAEMLQDYHFILNLKYKKERTEIVEAIHKKMIEYKP